MNYALNSNVSHHFLTIIYQFVIMAYFKKSFKNFHRINTNSIFCEHIDFDKRKKEITGKTMLHINNSCATIIRSILFGY